MMRQQSSSAGADGAESESSNTANTAAVSCFPPEEIGASNLVIDLPEFADGQPPTLQIASDLHIEFLEELSQAQQDAELRQMVTPAAPVLALLGDIGIPNNQTYRRFLLSMSDQFGAVLVLTGNHELYSHPPSSVIPVASMKRMVQIICDERPNLHFVDNTTVRLGSKGSAPALVCTPLWSRIPVSALDIVNSCINDYRLSFITNTQTLTAQCTASWHEAAARWIGHETERLVLSGCSFVGVLTHHAPFWGSSDPVFGTLEEGNVLEHAFCSDMSEQFEPEAVRLWAFGHTHYNTDRLISGARLVSNQRGYPDEPAGDYDPAMVISLDAVAAP